MGHHRPALQLQDIRLCLIIIVVILILLPAGQSIENDSHLWSRHSRPRTEVIGNGKKIQD